MNLEPISLIERIAKRYAPGRTPSFREVHVLKTMEILYSGERIGRKRLGAILRLGEGITRTLLRHLKKENLINVTRKGIRLTERGECFMSTLIPLLSRGTDAPRGSLTIGPKNFAVLIKGMDYFIRSGVEQRDAALRAGALGATTLVFNGERLIIPGLDESPTELEKEYNLLLLRLKPNKGDIIIIGSSNDPLSAELGAKTAAIELLKSMKRDSEDISPLTDETYN